MADIDSVLATPTVGGAAASPAKKKVTKTPSKSIKPKKTTSNHPATGEMVVAAIKSLKERGGSSLQAIKKQIATTYKVDVSKLSPFIKKFIKNAVVSGKLVQTKGKGASGSFKLAVSAKEQKEGKKLKVAKTSKTTKPKPKTTKAKSTEKKKTDKKPKKSLEKKSKKTPLKKPAPKKAASKPKETAKAKPAAKKAVKPTAKKVSKKPAAGTPKKSKK